MKQIDMSRIINGDRQGALREVVNGSYFFYHRLNGHENCYIEQKIIFGNIFRREDWKTLKEMSWILHKDREIFGGSTEIGGKKIQLPLNNDGRAKIFIELAKNIRNT